MTAIAKIEQQLVAYDAGYKYIMPEEKKRLAKANFCPNATDAELELFIHQCQRTGLDPFARQIHYIPRTKKVKDERGNWSEIIVYTTQVSIDGLRLIAERTGLYRGQTPVQWCGSDGAWVDVWLKSEPPVAARVAVLRSDFSEPLYAVALFSEYAQRGYENKLTGVWAKMPTVMLAKCAEALAMRKAFPQDLSGLYTDDEMQQADAPLSAGAAPPRENLRDEPHLRSNTPIEPQTRVQSGGGKAAAFNAAREQINGKQEQQEPAVDAEAEVITDDMEKAILSACTVADRQQRPEMLTAFIKGCAGYIRADKRFQDVCTQRMTDLREVFPATKETV